MTSRKILIPSLLAICALTACGHQSTPSMMSTNKPQLVQDTAMMQVPVKNVSDGYLSSLADSYTRFGSDTMHLSLVYDPTSKTYTAMKAFNDLSDFKARLKKRGVRNVTAETLQASGEPLLMISYDQTHATAPQGCQTLDTARNNTTTRFIGEYKFGCTIDTMVANQIYRPSDLRGNAEFDPGDGRRAANSTEHYRVVTEEEANKEMEVLSREQIGSQ